MNSPERSAFDSPSCRRPGDDLDGLLHSFFRAEMPDPWPACPEPPVQTIALPSRLARPRWSLARSRFALAASIALILGGLWALGGKFSAPVDAPLIDAKNPKAEYVKPYNDVDYDVKMNLIQKPEGTEIKIDFFDK